MMVTNESTALSEMSIAVNTGRSTVTKSGIGVGPYRGLGRGSIPIETKISRGSATVPITPSGSRMKIFISSHVNRQRPRSITVLGSLANRVAGQLEKHIFECRALRAEIDDAHVVLRKAANHVGDQRFSPPANREGQIVTTDRIHVWNRAKLIFGSGTIRHDHRALFRTVTPYQFRRRADIDDAAVIEDGNPITEAFRFFHEVRRKEHGFSPRPDAAYEFPDGAACLGSRPVVSSSRNTSSGSLISASAMNSRCFCPPDSVMNHDWRFSPSPSCSSSLAPSIGCSYSDAQSDTTSWTLMRFYS